MIKIVEKLIKLLFLGFLLLQLSSCQQSALSVQEHYFSHTELPSHRLETPNPSKFSSSKGNSIIIYWKLKKLSPEPEIDFLKLQVLFTDMETKNYRLPIEKRTGYFNVELPQKQVAASYKVELFEDNVVSERWTHKLWEEIIVTEEEIF
ncbi:MAG: hypothetical protein GWP59_01620 [Chlamydiales bacterium]|nr:hypothetical protein [Chlamydiales bacterium]